MSTAFDFIQATQGMNTDELWLAVVSHRGEPFANTLRPEGTSVVVVFPDNSSVFAHDLKSGRPRVEARS